MPPPFQLGRATAASGDTMTLDRRRRNDDGGFPPPKPPRKRGEGGDPKGGTYWMRGAAMVAVSGGKVNEIVNRSGYAVILEPEDYGLSAEEIGSVLNRFPSTRDEYQKFLDGKLNGEGMSAGLWRSSQMIFEMMLQKGWLWVRYAPPEQASFVVTPEAARRQIAAAAERLSLVQINKISVTLARDFKNLNDRSPQASDNKTLFFGHGDYQGFLGTFGAMMDWTRGKEAPLSNYLYTVGFLNDRDFVPNAVQSRKASVPTPSGRRVRYALHFSQKLPSRVLPGQVIFRVPISVGKSAGRELTPPNTKGTVSLFDERPFNLQPQQVEVFQDGKWVDYADAKKPNPYDLGEGRRANPSG